MPLTGAVVAGDAAYRDGAVAGSLRVHSLIFTTGWLEVRLGNRLTISASLSADGTASSVTLSTPGGVARVGTGTLVRQSTP